MNALALILTNNNKTAAGSAGADAAPLDPSAAGVDFAVLIAQQLSSAQTGLALLDDSELARQDTENASDARPGIEAFNPLAGFGVRLAATSAEIREYPASDTIATDDTPDAPASASALELVVPDARPGGEPRAVDALASTVALDSPTIAPQNPIAAQLPLTPAAQAAPTPEPATGVQAAADRPNVHENTFSASAGIADEAANIAARGETHDLAARFASAPIAVPEHDVLSIERTDLRAVEATPRAETIASTVLVQPTESRSPVPHPSALLEVSAPVSEPGFADALSRQVVWMVGKDAQVAELRINPPELGPVQVRLTLNGDEAVAQFASAHPEVREAIENAMARLRESLAQAGIQLGNTSVSAESFADQTGQHADAHLLHRSSYGGEQATADPTWSGQPSTTIVKRGLVDIFA